MTQSGRETEIKLAFFDAAAARSSLRSVGFRLSRRRVFEANIVFDGADQAIGEAGCLLRIRSAGLRSTLTFKGAPTFDKHKSREELEMEISDATALASIFGRLGLKPVFRYEKYRTEFIFEDGAAMLDETPIGVFVELEGPPEWIDRTAARMGFPQERYITASYASLYFELYRRLGKEPGNMIFSKAQAPATCRAPRNTARHRTEPRP